MFENRSGYTSFSRKSRRNKKREEYLPVSYFLVCISLFTLRFVFCPRTGHSGLQHKLFLIRRESYPDTRTVSSSSPIRSLQSSSRSPRNLHESLSKIRSAARSYSCNYSLNRNPIRKSEPRSNLFPVKKDAYEEALSLLHLQADLLLQIRLDPVFH